MPAAESRTLATNRSRQAGACALPGAVVHVALWQVSEPPDLFSDFYKAYYPAAEVLWENGFSTTFPFTEAGAGGFVNVPIMAWLFVPWSRWARNSQAGYFWLRRRRHDAGLSAAASDGAPRGRHRPRLCCCCFFVNGPLINSLREGNTTHFVLLLLIAGADAVAARARTSRPACCSDCAPSSSCRCCSMAFTSCCGGAGW